jgi:2,4-dienoyl-CoA reductase-like NADH-dependent reductase (Old Yellow Enzyme family)
MSGSETNPDGYDIDEGIEFAKALDGKVDIFTSHRESRGAGGDDITHPSMFLEDGCNLNMRPPSKSTSNSCCHRRRFYRIRSYGGGCGFRQADIIEMGRQTLADPSCRSKLEAAGRRNHKMHALSACFGNVGRHRIFYCAVNPVVGTRTKRAISPRP